jgi:Putative MetA-pathway of phenol degradation
MRTFIICGLIWFGNLLSSLHGEESWIHESEHAPSWLHEVQNESSSQTTLLQWSNDREPLGGPPSREDPLASDRPDFTEASCTVGKGVRQLEMGYTFTYDDDGTTRVNAHSVPEFLLRAGVLAEWLELRVGWNYAFETTESGGESESLEGSEDLYVGLKLGLTQQQGILPEMALMPQMTIPLGTSFTSNRVLPGVNWLYGWEINDFLSTAGSTQVNLALDDLTSDEYVEVAQSWTVGYSLGERMGAYTEWFVFIPAGAESARTQHYLDGGLTYSVTNDLQLDVRVGKGISSTADDFFSGAGAVVRW